MKNEKHIEIQNAERLAAAAPVPVCITNSDNEFICVNPAFEHFYGYSANHIIGCTPGMLVNASCPATIVKEVEESTQHKGGFCGEIENVTQSGKEVRIALQTAPIFNRKAKVVGMLAFAKPVAIIPKVLAPREKEIYRLLGHGSATKEIACKLGNNISTVSTLIHRMIDKLKLRDFKDLQCHAVRTMTLTHEINNK